MFGASMASYALCTIAQFPLDPIAHKNRTSLYQRFFKDLIARYRDVEGTFITPEEVGFLVDEVCHGKSVLSGRTDRLVLARWNAREPPRLGNVVAMTKEEATEHDKLATAFSALSTPPAVQHVLDQSIN
jgi:hypothetical protein